MKRLLTLFFASLVSISLFADDAKMQYSSYSPDGIIFKVSDRPWHIDTLGNHRAVVKASADGCKAVRTVLKWRRPDRKIDKTSLIIRGASTGKESAHFCIENPTSEKATIWFEPIAGEDTYYVYYMPYIIYVGHDELRFKPDYNDYIPYDSAAGAGWKESVSDCAPAEGKLVAFEAVNEFEAFTQMGNIATAEETASIAAAHPENPVIFTENRCFAIRLNDRLPVRWAGKQPVDSFEGEALRNEYYVWQIGLWAAHAAISDVSVSFSELRQIGGDAVIPASEQTCFNTEGTNWDGSSMDIDLDVPEGRIQALWCGVQVPEDIPAGTYNGTVYVSGQGMEPRSVALSLTVGNGVLADKGDGDLWRLSRLRWLNSTIGSELTPVGGYNPIKVNGQIITATDKTLTLGKNGLPGSIVVNGHEILSAPVRMEVETSEGTVVFNGGNASPESGTDGAAAWHSEESKNGITLRCQGSVEYQGHMLYTLSLSSAAPVEVKDIRFVADYTEYASKYLMGIGFEGGYRPANHVWDWSGLYDSFWMGGVEAGLHMEFRGDDAYHGPLLRDYRKNLPGVWYNDGKGRVSIVSVPGGARVTVSTGDCGIQTEAREFKLAMNVTPAKPVDTRKQFGLRLYHSVPGGFDKAAEDGANYCNIHHAQTLNPVINYPFIVREPLKEFINHEHQNGRKVKLYYTIRELTNYVAEVYALKSLNHEIMAGGHGGGAPWSCEHLVDDYWPAWYACFDGITDAAWVTSPQSRWINYYLEGMRWMIENYDIDGLYMDDISFDGTVMKRLRTVMDLTKPGCVIDLHSNTGYSNGPMNQYCDYMPFVDRLWFGESFRYNEMSPDNWLVTFSGIPFGPMSEMLQGGGNIYLGAVFGATNRHSTSQSSPVPIWKLWKEFGIEDSDMKGWWDDNCPVVTSDEDVKASSFIRNGSALVSIGNFSEEDKAITLDIDWKALGIRKNKAVCTIPEIENFQSAGIYTPGTRVSIPAKKGLVILVSSPDFQ